VDSFEPIRSYLHFHLLFDPIATQEEVSARRNYFGSVRLKKHPVEGQF
jgi:hypothetical protein